MSTKVKTDSELVEYFDDNMGLTLSSSELDYSTEEDRVLTYERLETILDDFSTDLDGEEIGDGVKVSSVSGKPYVFHLLEFSLGEDDSYEDVDVDQKKCLTSDFSSAMYYSQVYLIRVNQANGLIKTINLQTVAELYGTVDAWSENNSEYYAVTSIDDSSSIVLNITTANARTIWVYWGTSSPDGSSIPNTVLTSEINTTGDYYECNCTWPAYAYPWLYIYVVS